MKNQEAPASGLTEKKSREGEKMPNAKRNFEPCKKALTQKHEREKGCNRGGRDGAAVGQQQGRVSGRPIVTPARMNL